MTRLVEPGPGTLRYIGPGSTWSYSFTAYWPINVTVQIGRGIVSGRNGWVVR